MTNLIGNRAKKSGMFLAIFRLNMHRKVVKKKKDLFSFKMSSFCQIWKNSEGAFSHRPDMNTSCVLIGSKSAHQFQQKRCQHKEYILHESSYYIIFLSPTSEAGDTVKQAFQSSYVRFHTMLSDNLMTIKVPETPTKNYDELRLHASKFLHF